MPTRILGAVSALLLLSACAVAPPVTDTSGFHLANTSWLQRSPAPPEGVQAPNITFGADGRASGFAGCNQWFAAARRDAHGGLRFSAIGSTRRMCEPPAMQVERAFLAGLERTIGADYDSSAMTLRLIGGEADEIAVFDAWMPPGERR